MGKLVFAAALLAVWLAFRGRPKPYDVTSHLEDGCRTPLPEGRLYSRSVGAGPDLVLLPGFAGNTQTWEFVTPDLARDYRVHWLDPLGHGLSDKPADALDMTEPHTRSGWRSGWTCTDCRRLWWLQARPARSRR